MAQWSAHREKACGLNSRPVNVAFACSAGFSPVSSHRAEIPLRVMAAPPPPLTAGPPVFDIKWEDCFLMMGRAECGPSLHKTHQVKLNLYGCCSIVAHRAFV